MALLLSHTSSTRRVALTRQGRSSRLGWTGRPWPGDAEIAEIGDELAVARALSDLAHKLLHAADSDIEAITHEHIRLHG